MATHMGMDGAISDYALLLHNEIVDGNGYVAAPSSMTRYHIIRHKAYTSLCNTHARAPRPQCNHLWACRLNP